MCKIYIHIRKWSGSSSLYLASMGFKMFEKYWKLNDVILAFASILDSWCKMQVVHYYYKFIYVNETEREAIISDLQKDLGNLYAKVCGI